MKVLHTADLHFKNNPETLAEVVRVAQAIVGIAKGENPDAIILAGDVFDEMESRIRIDSDASRHAIAFVTSLAAIAPVVVVRGTKSHDREAPFIFSHLSTVFPVFVTSEPEIIGLYSHNGHHSFAPVVPDHGDLVAAFTMLPSLDKAWMMAHFEGSIKEANAGWRELLHDLLAGFGLINESLDCPCVLVGHGMLTGARFSSGQEAIGEDLEFGVDTLRAARADYVALGHVHKHQMFGSDIAYSGSPGRLNFGEPEEKGVLMVDVLAKETPVVRLVPTPARRFVFIDCAHDELTAELDSVLVGDGVKGAHVRVRFTIPEEHRHAVSRDEISDLLTGAGALMVKVESQIIPATRQRAAGISRIESLPEKVKKWGEATGQTIPEFVLDVASSIEAMTEEEMVKRFVPEDVEGDLLADVG